MVHEPRRIRTLRGARAFLALHAKCEKDYPCCYDHVGCSIYRGGPCLDETLANFEERLAEEDDESVHSRS